MRMKPYVICHAVASIDGRIRTSRWRPEDASRGEIFERLHDQLGVNAWLIGRISGQGYGKRDAYPAHTDQHYPREHWFSRRDAAAYGIVLDPHGKIAWGRRDVGGDPIVVVLTEQVSDAHLAGLREDEVSYIFAGARELDLALALDIPNRELGIKRLEVNGGGVTNAAFLRAGLIDEISVVILSLARDPRPDASAPPGCASWLGPGTRGRRERQAQEALPARARHDDLRPHHTASQNRRGVMPLRS